jgi:hypothetical protein
VLCSPPRPTRWGLILRPSSWGRRFFSCGDWIPPVPDIDTGFTFIDTVFLTRPVPSVATWQVRFRFQRFVRRSSRFHSNTPYIPPRFRPPDVAEVCWKKFYRDNGRSAITNNWIGSVTIPESIGKIADRTSSTRLRPDGTCVVCGKLAVSRFVCFWVNLAHLIRCSQRTILSFLNLFVIRLVLADNTCTSWHGKYERNKKYTPQRHVATFKFDGAHGFMREQLK